MRERLPSYNEQERQYEAELAKAAQIISDLMDMLKDHPSYHGSGTIDDAFVFLSQREQEGKPLPDPNSLESQIIEKFKGFTDRQLIYRIMRASDFNYDDEEYELNRRLKVDHLSWRWSKDASGNDVVEIIPLEIPE